jgi:Tfp pilus assembly protein PilN
MDLNKEIKLSDLFRRNKGAGEDEAPKADTPEKEKKERKSLSFSRKPKEPQEPTQPKASKDGGKVSPKSVPAPPAVPLMRAFNLMPRESERERTSASPAFLKVVVALVAVLVLASIAGAYMVMGARAKEQQAAVDDLRAQLAQIEAQAAEGQGPNTAALTVEGQARTAALSDALAARVAWDRILREFSLVLPEDVWLTTLSSASSASPGAVADPSAATAGGEATFTINGFATSPEAVATLLSRLEVIPEFASVQLQSSARGGGEAEGGSSTGADPQDFSFSIVAAIAPKGVPAE